MSPDQESKTSSSPSSSTPAADPPATPAVPAAVPAATPAAPVAPAAPAPKAAEIDTDEPAPDDDDGEPIDWDKESAPDEIQHEPAAPAPKPTTPAQPAAPAKPAVPAPAAQPAQPAAPAQPAVAQPAAPAPATPAQPAAQPAAPAKTPEEITAAQQAEAKKNFDNLVAYYKLPEDMAEKLPTEPEVVLPFMAARLHQEIARGVERMVQEALPHAIRNVMTAEQTEERSKKAFYDAWPQLSGYEKQVLEVGTMFRRLNPDAPPEEAIKRIGETVMTALGLQIAPGTAQPGAPAAPAQPAARQPVFQPAGGGGSGRGAPPADDNVFTQMAEELIEEDRG
jgi:hypothetical protein